MKIVTLKPEQFDKFAKNHRYRNYFQTSNYGSLMTKFGYNIHYLGIVSDTNKLIGATLLLYKQVFMSNKIAYAPRGFLLNYENIENLEEIIKKIKQVLGKQGFMLLRIDPYIPLTIRDSNGTIMNFNNQGNAIIENLKSVGFEYKGKVNDFSSEKPRWESLIILNNKPEQLFSRFDKRTRNKIRRATNFGIDAEKDEKKDIEKLYEYIKKNNKKPKSYYKALIEKFGDNAEVYYAKINTELYTVNSRRAYESEIENNNSLSNLIQDVSIDSKQKEIILNKKMESDKLLDTYKHALVQATNLLKEYPDGIIIGGALVIKYDNAAFLIEEGVDPKYRNNNPEYVIKWKMIEDYTKENLKYINLNGIIGEFEKQIENSSINEKKLGFNSTITEYIGEFDIILNNFSYNLYKSFSKNKQKKSD